MGTKNIAKEEASPSWVSGRRSLISKTLKSTTSRLTGKPWASQPSREAKNQKGVPPPIPLILMPKIMQFATTIPPTTIEKEKKENR